MAIIRLTKRDGKSMLLSTDEISRVEAVVSGQGAETVISLRNKTLLYVQQSVDTIEQLIALQEQKYQVHVAQAYSVQTLCICTSSAACDSYMHCPYESPPQFHTALGLKATAGIVTCVVQVVRTSATSVMRSKHPSVKCE